jgi:hypothetical protein
MKCIEAGTATIISFLGNIRRKTGKAQGLALATSFLMHTLLSQ